MIQLKRSTKRLITQKISTNPTLQRQPKKSNKLRERERERITVHESQWESINLNGNDNSIRCCNWEWRKSHHHQKMKRKSNRRRSRRNQEEGDRGRSRGREQGDPIAAKGSSRLDPIADGCSASLGCKLCIAMRLPIREPLTAPSNCWKPFLALFCSVSFSLFFWPVLLCFLSVSVCLKYKQRQGTKCRFSHSLYFCLKLWFGVWFGLFVQLVVMFQKCKKSLFFFDCFLVEWVNVFIYLFLYKKIILQPFTILIYKIFRNFINWYGLNLIASTFGFMLCL